MTAVPFIYKEVHGLYDACLEATYAKNDLLRRSHISFIHAHMNHFSKVAVGNFFFVSYPWFHNTMFFLWYKHLTLVACVLGSSLIWTCRILKFECLFWFFPPRLPAENNNKYSIFKIQNLTSPNRWAAEDIMSVPNDSYRFWADLHLEGHV